MSQKEFIDVNATYAFGAAQIMVHVLKQCGPIFRAKTS